MNDLLTGRDARLRRPRLPGVFRVTVLGRRSVALDTLELSVTRPADFAFVAGQYLQLALGAGSDAESHDRSRVFSIVSSPHDDDRLSVAFRQSTSGYKRSVARLPIGSQLLLAGPYGYFTLAGRPRQPLVLVAGGIGITPQLSMLRFARYEGFETPITLLYLNTDRARSAYLEEVDDLARSSPSLTVHHLRRLDEDLTARVAHHNPGATWFITGPPAMVQHARQIVARCGVDEHRVCAESFVGY